MIAPAHGSTVAPCYENSEAFLLPSLRKNALIILIGGGAIMLRMYYASAFLVIATATVSCSDSSNDLCMQDQKRCNGNIVEVCALDGKSWRVYEECGASRYCSGNQCLAVSPSCGDGQCTPPAESCGNCQADCGSCCGNGVCDLAWGETAATCPADCSGDGGVPMDQGFVPSPDWSSQGGIERFNGTYQFQTELEINPGGSITCLTTRGTLNITFGVINGEHRTRYDSIMILSGTVAASGAVSMTDTWQGTPAGVYSGEFQGDDFASGVFEVLNYPCAGTWTATKYKY